MGVLSSSSQFQFGFKQRGVAVGARVRAAAASLVSAGSCYWPVAGCLGLPVLTVGRWLRGFLIFVGFRDGTCVGFLISIVPLKVFGIWRWRMVGVAGWHFFFCRSEFWICRWDGGWGRWWCGACVGVKAAASVVGVADGCPLRLRCRTCVVDERLGGFDYYRACDESGACGTGWRDFIVRKKFS